MQLLQKPLLVRMGQLHTASSVRPTHHHQFATIKSLQDNSTWTTHSSDNSPWLAGGRASGQRAEWQWWLEVSLFPTPLLTTAVTATAPSSHPKKLGMVVTGGWWGGGSSQGVPLSHTSPLPAAATALNSRQKRPGTTAAVVAKVGSGVCVKNGTPPMLSCSNLVAVSWQRWLGGSKLTVVSWLHQAGSTELS